MAPESRTIDRIASHQDVESLKELLLERFSAHDREHVLLAQASEAARIEMDRRLEGMNNLRHQLEQAEAKFTTRAEWHSGHDAVLETLAENTKNTESRFRTVERQIWLAMGAVSVIAFLLKWIK